MSDKPRLTRLLHLLSHLRTTAKKQKVAVAAASKPDDVEMAGRQCDVYTISCDNVTSQDATDTAVTPEAGGVTEVQNDVTHDVTSCTGSSVMQEKVTSSLVVRFSDEHESAEELTELTEEQRAGVRQAFTMFEISGKGRIPSRDLGQLLRCLGWNPSEKELEEARQDIELSSRSTMTYAEVESYISRRGKVYYGNNAEEDMLVAFQVLDQAGTGRIPLCDFRRFLTTMGEQMSAEEAEELIAGSGGVEKDYIEYQDLVNAVT